MLKILLYINMNLNMLMEILQNIKTFFHHNISLKYNILLMVSKLSNIMVFLYNF